jgi:NTP pyrophosphatase (non-canonical NTP hydrolase)
MDAPLITSQNYRMVSIDDWQHEMSYLYQIKNSKRDPIRMWLRTVSDASKVGEAVRKDEFHEAMEQLSHTFAWILTTTDKLCTTQFDGQPVLTDGEGEPLASIADVLFAKYPGICPYCGKAEICHCPVLRKTIAKETKAERRNRLREIRETAITQGTLPKSLPDIAYMFDRIYGEAHYEVGLDIIVFHFLEEVGEVAWCLTSLFDGTKNTADSASLSTQLAEEIADTVAWGFAITNKIALLASQDLALKALQIPKERSRQMSDSQLNYGLLATWVWYTYSGPEHDILRCPKCMERPCHC